MELPSIIESLLIATEEPLKTNKLAELIRGFVADEREALEADKQSLPEDYLALEATSSSEIEAAIEALNQSYKETGRSFRIRPRKKGWQIYTEPEFAPFIDQLNPDSKPKRLSATALETLAIIAYRQPITKASIEAVRGVSADSMVQKLVELELIRPAGKADLPGKPMLFETTDQFFDHFGIDSIDELPNAAELKAVQLPAPAKDTLSEQPEPETTDDSPQAESPAETPTS